MEEIKKEEATIATNTVETKAPETEKATDNTANAEIEKLKRQLSKANSEAADYKRKWQEKASEKDEQLKSLLREKTVSEYSKKFLGIGYDTATAEKLASGLPDGVSNDFFEAQKKFFEQKSATLTAEALNTQPSISSGSVPQGNADNNDFLAAMRKAAGLTEK